MIYSNFVSQITCVCIEMLGRDIGGVGMKGGGEDREGRGLGVGEEKDNGEENEDDKRKYQQGGKDEMRKT